MTPQAGQQTRSPRRLATVLGPLAAVGVAFVVLPLVALLVRAPWRRLAGLLTQRDVRQALGLSFACASLATAAALVIGIPLAWILARCTFPGRRIVRALVTLPLVLPPVVGGVGLLYAFGRRGLLGEPLRTVGVTLPFTTAGVVMAETFVAMPFLVVAVEGALSGAHQRYEEAAATLGASEWTTFRRVTLPLIGPSIGAGTVLCFARALGEFGATITFAGNLAGTTQTTPLLVYVGLETQPDQAVALALVLLAASVTILVLLRDRWIRPSAVR
jgi:molybdate transport system permease protein